MQGPAGQLVEGAGRLSDRHGDHVTWSRVRRRPRWRPSPHREVRGQASAREHETDLGPGGGPAADVRQRPLGHHLAVGQHRHPVGQRLGLLHVVRGEQDRGARVTQTAHKLPRVPPGGRVEPCGRLVEEQQFRVTDQPQAEVQAAFTAAGQVPHLGPLLPGQADQRDHLIDAPWRRVIARVAGDGLADRQVGLDRDVLQDQPDPLPQFPARGPVAGIESQHLGPPGVPFPEALQDLQRRGFPGAVRPQQREDLAQADGEADPAQRGHRAVVLSQPVHYDRATHRTSSDTSR